jgi:hypothetical protein
MTAQCGNGPGRWWPAAAVVRTTERRLFFISVRVIKATAHKHGTGFGAMAILAKEFMMMMRNST